MTSRKSKAAIMCLSPFPLIFIPLRELPFYLHPSLMDLIPKILVYGKAYVHPARKQCRFFFGFSRHFTAGLKDRHMAPFGREPNGVVQIPTAPLMEGDRQRTRCPGGLFWWRWCQPSCNLLRRIITGGLELIAARKSSGEMKLKSVVAAHLGIVPSRARQTF